MQEVYLIRHGQAGSRTDYDRLSELGEEQAGRLGAYFARSGLAFDRVVCGGLRRQRHTAELVFGGGVEADALWNEFDLDAVYAEVGPRLAEVDRDFRREFEELRRQSEDAGSSVHRSWRRSDYQVVEAWVEDRFAVGCERWPDFRERIWRAWDQVGEGQRWAIVSSATPIGIVTARLFDAPAGKCFELAGALVNCSFTVLRRRGGNWMLSGFNHMPHLEEERLRTHR